MYLSSLVIILEDILIYGHQSHIRLFHQHSGAQSWRHKGWWDSEISRLGGQFPGCSQRTKNASYKSGIESEQGCRIGGRGIKSQFGFLSREVCYHYHVRNLTTGTRQTGDAEKDLDFGDISWNFISNIWLILIYFLRQSHWCHVFPHNAVFCASWETMIQHFLKQNTTIASGNFFQVVPNTHSVHFDDGSVFILLEGDNGRCTANA